MAVVRDVPVPASFVRFELPAALVFALMLYPMLRGDLRVSRAEGGILLAAFAAWVAFEVFLVHMGCCGCSLETSAPTRRSSSPIFSGWSGPAASSSSQQIGLASFRARVCR